MLSISGVAHAEIGASKARRALFADQFKMLDSRLPRAKSGGFGLERPRIIVPPKLDLQGYRGSYRGPFLSLARAAAQRHGIPEGLFLRLVEQESGWNPSVKSHKGAVGLAQLMPATARDLGVDPLLPAANLDGGARYLKAQYRAFGSWRLALAAYNAGPEAVRRHKGVPPYRETQKYIAAILKI
tara:strand:+ start:6923 stop:7474 length:552 start_codon:yes stop_codon:yes gene_type:complete